MGMASGIVTIYGVFSLVGGVIGYVKARSLASLMAGSLSGAILLVCAYGIGQGSRTALIGSALVALLLGGRFVGTWRKKRRLMPDLIMVVLSGATLITVGLSLVKR